MVVSIGGSSSSSVFSRVRLHLLLKKEFCGGGGGARCRQQAFCGVLLLARALAALLLTVVSSLAPQLLYFSNRVQVKQASKA